MPFEFLPQAFTAAAMRAHAPVQSGVYGIATSLTWLYIGETDNIQRTLLEHLRESHLAAARHGVATRHRPTGFVFEICPEATRPERQDQLVMEYEPAVNRGGTWQQ